MIKSYPISLTVNAKVNRINKEVVEVRRLLVEVSQDFKITGKVNIIRKIENKEVLVRVEDLTNDDLVKISKLFPAINSNNSNLG